MAHLIRQPLKILVADNNARWRRHVRSIFAADATIFECGDGTDAVLTFRKVRPDWVIMDIAMEPMDGLAAVKQIKAEDPGAQVVFLTQFCEPEFRLEADRLGAAAYVLKDNLDQLEDLIHAGSDKNGGSQNQADKRNFVNSNGF